MRKRRTWRYYCDYCKKANCSSYAISEHEKRCTMNPQRECRMCAQDNKKPKPMEILKPALAVGMYRLRALTRCPACILAAIRQSGKSAHDDYQFEYEVEFKKYSDDIQEEWLAGCDADDIRTMEDSYGVR